MINFRKEIEFGAVELGDIDVWPECLRCRCVKTFIYKFTANEEEDSQTNPVLKEEPDEAEHSPSNGALWEHLGW